MTQSEPEEDSYFHVEEPITQFVPERRNEGSLDLYSDNDKYSNNSASKEAKDDLAKYLTERNNRENKPVTRASPQKKPSGDQTDSYQSSEEEGDCEMTYQPGRNNFAMTQPVNQDPSDYEPSD